MEFGVYELPLENYGNWIRKEILQHATLQTPQNLFNVLRAKRPPFSAVSNFIYMYILHSKTDTPLCKGLMAGRKKTCSDMFISKSPWNCHISRRCR